MSRSLNRPKSALIKSRIVSLLFSYPLLLDLKFHHLTATAVKAVPDLHITSQFFLVCRYWVQQSIFACQLSVTYVRKLSSVQAGISWIACALLWCHFNRYWSNTANLISELHYVLWQINKIWDFSVRLLWEDSDADFGYRAIAVKCEEDGQFTWEFVCCITAKPIRKFLLLLMATIQKYHYFTLLCRLVCLLWWENHNFLKNAVGQIT